MLGIAATRSLPRSLHHASETVLLPADLHARGFTNGAIRAQLDARRWRRLGRAFVLHNGALRRDEVLRAAMLNCGPRAPVDVLHRGRGTRPHPVATR